MTKRERRELARKNKLDQARKQAQRRRRQRLTSILTFLLVVAVIGALVTFSRQADKNKAARLNELAVAAGCAPVATYEDELASGVPHATPPATIEYKTNPPTSGNHYGNSPQTGIFGAPRQNEAWVHGLEHGHIGILYKEDLAAPVKAELEKFVRERNTLTFIQPRPENDETLVAVSWTKALRCSSPTDPKKVREVIDLFYQTNVGNAPEGKIPGQPVNENSGEPQDLPSMEASP
jgi:type II secretory pathway pseudopilin PulG